MAGVELEVVVAIAMVDPKPITTLGYSTAFTSFKVKVASTIVVEERPAFVEVAVKAIVEDPKSYFA